MSDNTNTPVGNINLKHSAIQNQFRWYRLSYQLEQNWMHQKAHTHTTILLLFWNMSGTTRVSRYQKGKTRKVKTNLDLLEQEIVSSSGIKCAPHPR